MAGNIVEFRVITNVSKTYVKLIETKHNLSFIPRIGEMVSIEGEPYKVNDVSYMYDEGPSPVTYVYVNMYSPYGNF